MIAALLSAIVVMPSLPPAGAQETGPPGDGVVITETGLVLPVREKQEDSYRVTTTCWNEATVRGGTHLSHVEVVIDPGHGGSETGAVGRNGLSEKALNLAVSKLLAEELRSRGFSTVLTRTDDIRVPLVVRAEIARALKSDVFISVHHNGGAVSRSDLPGTEIFHQIQNPNSRRLAGILFEEIQGALAVYDISWRKTALQGASSVWDYETDADLFGILRRTPGIATVITEAAYLSNLAEARLLADPAVQKVEAVAIADGIERYLTTPDPGSGFNRMFSFTRPATTGGVRGCPDFQYDDIGLDEPGFDDQSGDYLDGVNELADYGILAGTECGPDLICPDQSIRRWMMAVWLVRAIDGRDPDPILKTRFADSPTDRWWTPFVERLAELEITRGCAVDPVRFCPYETVTRAQAASLISRAFPLPETQDIVFADVKKSSHAEAINQVVAAGITGICSEPPARYCPGEQVTKAQAAMYMARALRIYPPPLNPSPPSPSPPVNKGLESD